MLELLIDIKNRLVNYTPYELLIITILLILLGIIAIIAATQLEQIDPDLEGTSSILQMNPM